jgi:hypothetical protein
MYEKNINKRRLVEEGLRLLENKNEEERRWCRTTYSCNDIKEHSIGSMQAVEREKLLQLDALLELHALI